MPLLLCHSLVTANNWLLSSVLLVLLLSANVVTPFPTFSHRYYENVAISSKTALFVAQSPHPRQAGGAAQERRKAESLESGHHPLMSLNLNLDSLAQGGAAQRAQELLQRIEALYEEGYYAVSPDSVSYNSVLKAWVKRNSPEKALELLQTMEEKQKHKNNNLHSTINSNSNGMAVDGGENVLNVISYNTVIHAYAQNGQYEEAEQLLRKMQEHADPTIIPDTVTFNSVLYAYAQSNKLDAPPKAEELLREMMTEENQAQVDTTSFNIVLHAWAQSKQPHAPFRAQELLTHMETLSLAGNAKVRPDVYSYTTVIQAWVAQLRQRYRRRESKSRGNHFDKTQQQRRPGSSSSSSSSNGDSSDGTKKTMDAARAAKEILIKMEAQQLQPNQVTYTSVMTALCWSGKPQEAHELLLDLLERFKQQQEMVGDSLSAASMLVKPDTITFSAVMDGWVKNAHTFPQASERVLELFDTMKYWHAKGYTDMGPNSRTYTSVMSALAKSRTWDACLQAKQLLAEVPDGGPTVIHYNAVLNAFAKSPRADKARHAKAILEDMMIASAGGKYPSVLPDLISFNTVISACAGSFGSPELKKESLSIATSVFNHICRSDDLEPSPYTFSVMIKALRKLVYKESTRCEFVSKIFKICCKHGSLNAGVWQQVKKSIPYGENTAELWNDMLGEDVEYSTTLQLSALPKEWKIKAKSY